MMKMHAGAVFNPPGTPKLANVSVFDDCMMGLFDGFSKILNNTHTYSKMISAQFPEHLAWPQASATTDLYSC